MKKNLVKRLLFLFFFAVIALSALFLSKSAVFASDILINEVFPHPLSGEKEWVEFYNPSDTEADLSNYYFDDDDSLIIDGQIQKGTADPGSDPQKLSGLVPSKSTCFLNLSSYLNNDKDKPTVFILDGTVVDTYEYTDSTQNKSFARIPDGAEWQTGQDPSKSSTECSSLIPSPSSSLTIIDTPTPSPTPTLTPTKSPTPTPTRSGSTKTPTPKVTTASKLTATLKPTATQKYSFASNTNILTPTKLITKSIQKTVEQSREVLGQESREINFLTKTPTASETPKIKTEVLGTSQNNVLSKVLIGLGSIFIIACGILAIRAYKNKYEE